MYDSQQQQAHSHTDIQSASTVVLGWQTIVTEPAVLVLGTATCSSLHSSAPTMLNR